MPDSGFLHAAPCPTSATVTCSEDDIDAVERWRLAGLQVRLCVHPDEPRLIQRFLALGRGLQSRDSISGAEAAVKAAQLLLDSATDAALPLHWRQQCLDNVYRPLGDLTQSAKQARHQRQLRALSRRLATLDIRPENSAYPGDE